MTNLKKRKTPLPVKPDLDDLFHLNSMKMGMRPKNATWEWYTIRLAELFYVHVHNRHTEGGKWGYTLSYMEARVGHKPIGNWDTKEEALQHALEEVSQKVKQLTKELGNLMEMVEL